MELSVSLKKKNEISFDSKDSNRFHLLSDLIGAAFIHQSKDISTLLSNREIDVAMLVKEGKTNPEIAETLYISPNTVKKHLQHIYQKYNVTNRTMLARKL